MDEARIHVSVEAPGQHLVLDGHLGLLGQVLDALRIPKERPQERRSARWAMRSRRRSGCRCRSSGRQPRGW